MKIGPFDNKIPAAPLNSDRKATATDGNAAPAKGVQPAAKGAQPAALVQLSATASALATSDADGTFDSAKVERIGQAIKDGSYKVNAEVIADKLISNAQELLGRKQR